MEDKLGESSRSLKQVTSTYGDEREEWREKIGEQGEEGREKE